MKNESGSAFYGAAVKTAVCLIVFLGMIVYWQGRSRRDVRPAQTSDSDARSAGLLYAEAPGAQRRSDGARPAPLKVQPFRGQYCASVGPPGWAVIAENPQRVAFGADFASGDGQLFAGYSIFSSGPMAPAGFENPHSAVAATLTGFGTVQVQFRNRRQLAQNVFMLEYQSPTNHGIAFYQVIPAPGVGYMIVLRTAGTGNARGLWERRASEAMAVARSLRCQVPMVPAAPDPPGLNAKSKSRSNNDDESDTLYNRWLEREYYHNSQTGENYWVSPSEDYSQNGPDGPGYYAPFGGNMIKLTPGYSQ